MGRNNEAGSARLRLVERLGIDRQMQPVPQLEVHRDVECQAQAWRDLGHREACAAGKVGEDGYRVIMSI